MTTFRKPKTIKPRVRLSADDERARRELELRIRGRSLKWLSDEILRFTGSRFSVSHLSNVLYGDRVANDAILKYLGMERQTVIVSRRRIK